MIGSKVCGFFELFRGGEVMKGKTLVVCLILYLISSAILQWGPTLIVYAEPGPRFWYHVQQEPKGARLQFKYEADKKWTDVNVCDKWEFSRKNPLCIRNIGINTAVLEGQASSTGNPNQIDRWWSTDIKPGADFKVRPTWLIVIAGTIVGIIKGIGGFIGDLISYAGPNNVTLCNATVWTADSYYELQVSVTDDRIRYLLWDCYGSFDIKINSIKDPTVRSLTEPGEYITYDTSGNFVSHGYITAGIGGTVIPVNKLVLLAPYLTLVTIIIAMVIVTVYVRKRWLKREIARKP